MASGSQRTNVHSADEAEILSLGEQWKSLHAQRTAALDQIELAERKYYELRPAFPATLIKTQADAEMQLCVPRYVGERFDPRVFDTWRGKPMKRPVKYDVTPEIRASRNLPEDATSIVLMEVWPERQARADQIINDWDAYTAELARAEVESGLVEANARYDEIKDVLDPIEERIILARATTMAGFLVKIRLAASYTCVKPDHLTPDFDETLKRDFLDRDIDELCALSLLRDLHSICGETVTVRDTPYPTYEQGEAA